MLPPDARWTTLSGHTVKLCREAAMQRLWSVEDAHCAHAHGHIAVIALTARALRQRPVSRSC